MGCANSVSEAEPPASNADGGTKNQPSNPSNPIAEFDCSMGKFKAEIFLERVPLTASNFIDLCQSGFYEGIHFHRVIPDFMNQFGCPLAKNPKAPKAGTGGPPDGDFLNLQTGQKETRSNGGNIKDEHVSKDTNCPGSLSMANTGQPNSGGSQFFINVSANSNLDWFSPGSSKHPVFGQVIENYELCVLISQVKTQADNPVQPIRMKSITITNLPPVANV
eukprot:TRINITY_DN46668_c0_g1_i1.p1 TRINITY_DN46668_c0_g1~~TRINITY_DN46668_c0_g1_i1.p1  ORF type:complete len:220 (-),score=29.36 TRINITY_DN46668_c0_g1_i1:159-818(-)